MDPVDKKPMPLHLLWDSNIYRSTELEAVEKTAAGVGEEVSRARHSQN